MGRLKRNKTAGCTVLPREIIFSILSKLTVESLFRFKCVCKSWCSLISDPFFSDKHHKLRPPSILFQSLNSTVGGYQLWVSADDDGKKVRAIPMPSRLGGKFSIVGSCNGSLCIITWKDIIVCNPFTKKCIVLPEIESSCRRCGHVENGRCFEILQMGFGFHQPSMELKVVRMRKEHRSVRKRCMTLPSHRMICEVITLGSKAWRKLSLPFDADDVSFDGFYGMGATLYMNREMYWLASEINSISRYRRILSLDIGSEKFQLMSWPPPHAADSKYEHKYMVPAPEVLDGHLALLEIIEAIMCLRIRFLVDRVKNVWTQKYSIDLGCLRISNQFWTHPFREIGGCTVLVRDLMRIFLKFKLIELDVETKDGNSSTAFEFRVRCIEFGQEIPRRRYVTRSSRNLRAEPVIWISEYIPT